MLLLGKLAFKQGYIQAGPKDLKVLGGSVAKLVEKWEANRLVEMTGRVYSGQVPSGWQVGSDVIVFFFAANEIERRFYY